MLHQVRSKIRIFILERYFGRWIQENHQNIAALQDRNTELETQNREPTEKLSPLNAMEDELLQLRSEKQVLESRIQYAKHRGQEDATNALLSVLCLSDEELAGMALNFPVYPETEECEFSFADNGDEPEDEPERRGTGRWEVVTGYCQLGGCESTTVFGDRKNALIYAATRTKLGQEPSTVGACSSCYAEYVRELI